MNDYISSFRTVYPEKFIRIVNVSENGKTAVITADFPDGRFYFVITKNTVSTSYNTFAAAKKDADSLNGVLKKER